MAQRNRKKTSVRKKTGIVGRNKKKKTTLDSQGGTSWITRRLEWTLKQDTNPLN